MRRAALVVTMAALAAPGCALFSAIDDPLYPPDDAATGADSFASDAESDAPAQEVVADGDTGVVDTGSDAASSDGDADAGAETDAVDALGDAAPADGDAATDWGTDASADAVDGAVADSAGDVAPDVADTMTCTPGAATCAGTTLKRCSDAGVVESVGTCATPELCDASGTGTCKTPACAVGEKRCVGKSVEVCNAGRTGFVAESTCAVGCAAGACLTITEVSAGGWHSCALISNGTVRCWGKNGQGQLGHGSTANSGAPTEVPGLSGVVQVAAGGDHTCARLADATAKCWGSNQWYQIGDGAPSVTRVYPSSVFLLANIAELSIGYSLSCARLADGTAKCWGQEWKPGTEYPLATAHGTPVAIAVSSLKRVAVGSYHACGLKTDGTVWCWWGGSWGEHGDGRKAFADGPVKALVSGVKDIVAGDRYTCALLDDGTVNCWGRLFPAPDEYGSTPVAIAGLTGVTSLVGSAFSICATSTAGGTRCWGFNEYGSLGDGTTATRVNPVAPTALASALAGRKLSLGYEHTQVFDATSVFGVGNNDSGQLGTGVIGGSYASPPVKVVW